jgi:hypothetical protein
MRLSLWSKSSLRQAARSFEIRSKSNEGGKWFYKGVIKHSYFEKDDEKHFIERSIDRDLNEYHERIVKIATGEVMREVHEPLTSHTGRGSAKTKKTEN